MVARLGLVSAMVCVNLMVHAGGPIMKGDEAVVKVEAHTSTGLVRIQVNDHRRIGEVRILIRDAEGTI